MTEPAAHKHSCPSCQAVLAPGTVLCVACGYHLKLGVQLATSVEREEQSRPTPVAEPPDANPYASPSLPAEQARHYSPGVVSDLTADGARRAEALVKDADTVWIVLLLAFTCCAPAGALALPWYAYRWYCWETLNSSFAELRSPHSLSPYGSFTGKFPAARVKLIAGVLLGVLWWCLAGLSMLARSAH